MISNPILPRERPIARFVDTINRGALNQEKINPGGGTMCVKALYILCIFATLYTADFSYAQSYPNEQHSFDPESIWAKEFSIHRVSRGGFSLANRVTVNGLAQVFAPILVFSPDEPWWDRNDVLFTLDRPEFISYAEYGSPHPTYFRFEKHSESPIVYYRVSEIQPSRPPLEYFVQSDTGIDASELKLLFIKRMGIEYYFYYPYEVGLGAHTDDIESIKVEIEFFKAATEDSVFVAISKIIGRAHGSFWLDNVLDVDKIDQNVKMPITVLVEEGKHASCPDRNADGTYTPGYDVNVNIYDAWGIRDNQRTSTFYSPAYKAWMTKSRSHYSQKENKFFPPYFSANSITYDLRYFRDPAYLLDSLTIYTSADSLRKLYDKDKIKFGSFVAKVRNYQSRSRPVKGLKGFLKRHDELRKNLNSKPTFKNPAEDQNDWFDRNRSIIIPDNFWNKLSINYRYDGQRKIVSHIPFFVSRNWKVPILRRWILPRFTFQIDKRESDIREYGAQLFYTPSASRNVDWYSAIGYEKIEPFEIAEIDHGEQEPLTSEWQWSLEAGIKLAFNTNNQSVFRFLRFLQPSGWVGKPGFVGGKLGF